MKIVADENIPEVGAAFADLGEVELLPGRQITAHQLRDCDCLLVRTVTEVNRNLLRHSKVKFVGTATIGTDHVDLDYLARSGIAFSNAAGCNAEAASEYVISGLFALTLRKGFDPLRRKAGIVGCGNVGSRLLHKLQTLGIDTLVCDPPLAAAGARDYVSLERILADCDFISLHVPLTQSGNHATFHMLDSTRLAQLNPGCLLVNAARGPVIDNRALSKLLETRSDLSVFLDTWEGEPQISRGLLQQVDLATPHIAGYSVEGRLRGTQMILDAACAHFAQQSRWRMDALLPDPISLAAINAESEVDYWQQLFAQHHDIWQDHLALTNSAHMNDDQFAKHFDSLRRVYEQRFEYSRYSLVASDDANVAAIAGELGFNTAAE